MAFRKMKGAVQDFLGLKELSDDSREKIRQRRMNCYRGDVAPTKPFDEPDASCVCRPIPRRSQKSVATLAWKKAKVVVGVEKFKKKELGKYGRSFAPATLDFERKPNFEQYKNEMFYDEFSSEAPPRAEVLMPRGRASEPDGATAEEDLDEADGYTHGDIQLRLLAEATPRVGSAPVGMSRMNMKVKEKQKGVREAMVLQIEKRTCEALSCNCKQPMDDDYSKRPYFTYFITVTQTIILITAMAVYGVAKIGVDEISTEDWVRKPNMAIESVRRTEFGNIWIGPKQAALIHLGAKYSPCMRRDPNLQKVLELDRNEERKTGCCIRDDGSGCVQTVKHRCNDILSTFMKWNNTHPGKGDYKSGAVCGQDPNYCKTPSSKPPFEWDKEDMTNWPICEDTSKPGHVGPITTGHTDRHMTCDLLGRPCCHGIQGECMITSREHCDFLEGYYHDEAFLCSQVNCMGEVCGMIPFLDQTRPDQFGRVFSSFLLHAGIFHLLLSILFHMVFMRTVERMIGWIRMAIIYVMCGAVGSLASASLLPYQVEVGPAGAQFGVIAVMFVDMVNNIIQLKASGTATSKKMRPIYQMLIICVVVILILFTFGLLPWLDNWAHLFGFIYGIFLSLLLIKDFSLENKETGKGLKRVTIVIISLIILIAILVMLLLIFYVAPITSAEGISYFNCIPFTETFCKNMDVSINRGSTYITKL